MNSDDIWKRSEIDSPCVKTCVMDDTAGLCTGCFRTRAEIANWSGLSPEMRREIMAALPERAGMLTPRRRGGRSGRKLSH